MIFAIGDVHGCADELRLLLNRLPRTPDTTIVFLGDYVDRGPSSREVIETVLELGQQCNVAALLGNHEVMFLDYIDDPSSAEAAQFIYNGGSATLASYADDAGDIHIPDSHVAFLRSLRSMYQTPDHVFVHAGLPQMPLEQIDPEADKPTLLWTRGAFLTTSFDWGKVVVHGHTPVKRVTSKANRINIDTACVFNGRLTAIALPGETVFSVKRMKLGQRVMLRDPSGTRAAHRFVGTVPVRVERGSRVEDLVTIDYSEIGMALRALDPSTHVPFHEGERIRGVVAPDDRSPVAFSGLVVRRKIDDQGIRYGVKIEDALPTTFED